MNSRLLNKNAKIRVLIADDHRLVAEAFCYLLESTDLYSVTIVCDALEARTEIKASGGFDLMLLDLDMPGIDGPETIKSLATLNGKGKTVILTGGNMALRQSSIFCAGAVGLILKSQSATEILEALTTILEGELYFPRADDRNLVHTIPAAQSKAVA